MRLINTVKGEWRLYNKHVHVLKRDIQVNITSGVIALGGWQLDDEKIITSSRQKLMYILL